jgi:hypothetical protein
MATVPSLVAKVAGNRIRATDFNAVKDYLDFLIDPPKCGVFDGAGLTYVNSTAKLVTYNSESYDTDGMHNTTTNNSRIVFVTSGRYELNIFHNLPAGTVYTTYSVNLRLNSGGTAGGGSSLRTWSNANGADDFAASVNRQFDAGDYVELFVTQTSGGSVVGDGSGGLFSTGIQAQYIALD